MGDPDFLLEALTRATRAAFIKESRMKFREANKLPRKSGGSPTIVVEPAESNRKESFSAHVRLGERGAPVKSRFVLGIVYQASDQIRRVVSS